MGTLVPTLTLTDSTTFSDEISFSITDSLTTTAPSSSLSTIGVTNVGANNIIQPATDGQTRYIFIRHAGASGTINVELTGDVIIGKLAVGEFMFMPVGGHSLGCLLYTSPSPRD